MSNQNVKLMRIDGPGPYCMDGGVCHHKLVLDHLCGVRHCAHDTQWDIVGPDGAALGQSWGDHAFVSDLCDELNDAYAKGRASLVGGPQDELPPLDENTMRGPAWQALYDRFNELPVPQERVWEIQADLTSALSQLRQRAAHEALYMARCKKAESALAAARDEIAIVRKTNMSVQRESIRNFERAERGDAEIQELRTALRVQEKDGKQ